MKGLSTPLRDRHPAVPWKQVAGMRDLVNHKYYGVDLTTVWLTVERDLPDLRRAITDMLATDPEVAE